MTDDLVDLHKDGKNLCLSVGGRLIFLHSPEDPFIRLGRGESFVTMNRGNFRISDNITDRLELPRYGIKDSKDGVQVVFSHSGGASVEIRISEQEGRSHIIFESVPEWANRIWVRLFAEPSEKVYGCGEQFSYFNLRGRRFPLWTSEPGVGRDPESEVTRRANEEAGAGGDYHHTNFPAPLFVSSRLYYCQVESSSYMEFDFQIPVRHVLHAWSVPRRIVIGTGESWPALMEDLTSLTGRQPRLPEWPHQGIILGIQGGGKVLEDRLGNALDAGVKVSGVWCQDWAGVRMTSFGKRLRWDWKTDRKLYPDLERDIAGLKEKGIRFLAYINPYLASDGGLFQEAAERGFLVKTFGGEVYKVDFGEFNGGMVDLTNPDAWQWYKAVIKSNLLDSGCSGWMADFGEYLPVDCMLYNGGPSSMHNQWPMLWARLHYELLADEGKLGEVLCFFRAGFSGTQKYAPLLWAGDQCVDWTSHDGIPAVIPAALSAGVSGIGFTHCDIGGYTALYGLSRSKELYLRWLEMSAFTLIMRTHEGNRPDLNHQFDSDMETLQKTARMSGIHARLAPYLKNAACEYVNTGLPVQRPLFVHYPEDPESLEICDQYLLGRDLLVAPVIAPGKNSRQVHLPPDQWVHLWSKKEYSGGTFTVEAPLGQPPVFYRKSSEHVGLFSMLAAACKTGY